MHELVAYIFTDTKKSDTWWNTLNFMSHDVKQTHGGGKKTKLVLHKSRLAGIAQTLLPAIGAIIQ